MKPDIAKYNPDPEYMRKLVRKAGLTQEQAGERIGVSARSMRYYLSLDKASHKPAPYSVQFCLERLATGRRRA